jgi:hypothetical protein
MDGPGIAAVAVGVIFVYGGIKGYSPIKALENVITGKNPNENQSTSILTSASGTSANAGSAAPGASSYNQLTLAQLWQSNGGTAATAKNAACHAMQESSGNPAATSSNPDGGINVGLWQLDTKGVGVGYTIAQLQNPNTNAKVAISGSKNGTDWGPWATPGC